MSDFNIKSVLVIGAGVMGTGIAYVCATSGFFVYLNDISEEIIKKSLDNIKNGPFGLERAVKLGKLSRDQADSAFSRIYGTTKLNEVAKKADIVIEAVFEDLDLKRKIFKEIDTLCPNHTILATNTSTIPITRIASATNRPEKVIGLHFSNPVPVMRILEVIPGIKTSQEVLNASIEFGKKLGKEVVVSKDRPGFIGNRLLIPLLNLSCKILEEGVATKEDIDKAVKLAFNWPMGPFELLDLIGIDTAVKVSEAIYNELRDPNYAPHPLLKLMAEAGLCGRKSGKGFYSYT